MEMYRSRNAFGSQLLFSILIIHVLYCYSGFIEVLVVQLGIF